MQATDKLKYISKVDFPDSQGYGKIDRMLYAILPFLTFRPIFVLHNVDSLQNFADVSKWLTEETSLIAGGIVQFTTLPNLKKFLEFISSHISKGDIIIPTFIMVELFDKEILDKLSFLLNLKVHRNVLVTPLIYLTTDNVNFIKKIFKNFRKPIFLEISKSLFTSGELINFYNKIDFQREQILFLYDCAYQFTLWSAKCEATESTIAVMGDGSIYPCRYLSSCERFCLGNIFTEQIEDVRQKFIHIKQYELNSCANCDIANYCSKCIFYLQSHWKENFCHLKKNLWVKI